MNLTIFDSVPQSGSAPLSIDPRSLYHALEQVKDGRKARGKRYPLALIFTLLLLGKLAGETTLHGQLARLPAEETIGLASAVSQQCHRDPSARQL